MARHDKDRPNSASDDGTFENLGRKLDERPEIQAAEKALRKARKQLYKAQAKYQHVRGRASEKVEELRAKNVGDLLESTLELVRKHPGPGVLAALACGMFLGRLFRR